MQNSLISTLIPLKCSSPRSNNFCRQRSSLGRVYVVPYLYPESRHTNPESTISLADHLQRQIFLIILITFLLYRFQTRLSWSHNLMIKKFNVHLANVCSLKKNAMGKIILACRILQSSLLQYYRIFTDREIFYATMRTSIQINAIDYDIQL